MYREESQAVIRMLRDSGRVTEIDAQGDVNEVFLSVEKFIARLTASGTFPFKGLSSSSEQEPSSDEPAASDPNKWIPYVCHFHIVFGKVFGLNFRAVAGPPSMEDAAQVEIRPASAAVPVPAAPAQVLADSVAEDSAGHGPGSAAALEFLTSVKALASDVANGRGDDQRVKQMNRLITKALLPKGGGVHTKKTSWCSNAMGPVLALLRQDGLEDQAKRAVLGLCQNMTNRAPFRVPMRDLGILDGVMGLLLATEGRPLEWDGVLSSILMNLSRSDTVHAALRDVQLLEALVQLLHRHPDKGDIVVFRSLVALSHVYGSERSDHPAQKLLSEHDISQTWLLRLLDEAIGAGKTHVGTSGWSVEEILHAIQDLSANADAAIHMVDAGILPRIASVLGGRRAASPDDPADVLLKVTGRQQRPLSSSTID